MLNSNMSTSIIVFMPEHANKVCLVNHLVKAELKDEDTLCFLCKPERLVFY